MGKIELLGLPGSGKSYLLKKMAAGTGELSADNIPNGFGLVKLNNLLLGFATIGPVPLLVLLRMARGKKIFGQIKLLLVLCERAGRLRHAPASAVIDEGILQALWGFFWRVAAANRQEVGVKVSEVVIKLKPTLPQVYYLRTRRDLHRQRVVIGDGPETTQLFRFVGEDEYLRARSTMALLLRALRACGVAVTLKSNMSDDAPNQL